MKLSEVFEQLTYGELSQLHIGGGAEGAITEANYPKILAHINLGLTTLYKRFNIREKELLVTLQPELLHYSLDSKFAVNAKRSKELVRYIIDTSVAPFNDDIIKILRVYTNSGFELDLNNKANPYSLHTPSLNSLTVPAVIVDKDLSLPDELKTTNLRVAYRANHPQLAIPQGYFNPARVELELPDSYLMALLLFIASRIHNPVGMTNEFHTGNNYAAKFEAECQSIEQYNVTIDQGSQNTRSRRAGWV